MSLPYPIVYSVTVAVSCCLSFPLSSAVPDYRHINKPLLNHVQKQYGTYARHRVSRWGKVLNKHHTLEPEKDVRKLNVANDFFNKIHWEWDINHWGQEDYWATPIETLGTNAGDCEDFSIGKYFSLTSMGMDTSKLRITYVKALEYDLAHMVLAYYHTPNAEPLILDNINKTILPASKRTDLLPIYGFNGDGIWMAQSNKQYKGDPSKNIPSWGKMTERLQHEWN